MLLQKSPTRLRGHKIDRIGGSNGFLGSFFFKHNLMSEKCIIRAWPCPGNNSRKQGIESDAERYEKLLSRHSQIFNIHSYFAVVINDFAGCPDKKQVNNKEVDPPSIAVGIKQLFRRPDATIGDLSRSGLFRPCAAAAGVSSCIRANSDSTILLYKALLFFSRDDNLTERILN